MSLFSGQRSESLQRWALGLVVVTLAWNVVEGVIATGAGLSAGSIALVGFGFDSAIEVMAAGVILWRFTLGKDSEEESERRAVLLIGVTLLLLAAYISAQSLHTLATQSAPEESAVGIALAVLSLIVMPSIALGKRLLARRLGSPSLEAEATETLVCAYLSLTLLAGLGLNALFGWWWADPAAALLMVYFVAREGWKAVTRRELCCAGGVCTDEDCACPSCQPG